MSTKIYDAYKFNGNIIELMPFLAQVKDEVSKMTIDYIVNSYKKQDEYNEADNKDHSKISKH